MTGPKYWRPLCHYQKLTTYKCETQGDPPLSVPPAPTPSSVPVIRLDQVPPPSYPQCWSHIDHFVIKELATFPTLHDAPMSQRSQDASDPPSSSIL